MSCAAMLGVGSARVGGPAKTREEACPTDGAKGWGSVASAGASVGCCCSLWEDGIAAAIDASMSSWCPVACCEGGSGRASPIRGRFARGCSSHASSPSFRFSEEDRAICIGVNTPQNPNYSCPEFSVVKLAAWHPFNDEQSGPTLHPPWTAALARTQKMRRGLQQILGGRRFQYRMDALRWTWTYGHRHVT